MVFIQEMYEKWCYYKKGETRSAGASAPGAAAQAAADRCQSRGFLRYSRIVLDPAQVRPEVIWIVVSIVMRDNFA